MAQSVAEGLANDRATWSFGRLLAWHFVRGTRSVGQTDAPGRKWTPKAFADALGVGDRTVRYWLRDQHLPPEIESIERLLFGNLASYGEWRLELRYAHATTWNAKRTNVASKSLDALAEQPFVGVPPQVAGFTGREDELDRLDATLVQGRAGAVVQTVGRTAVHGLGGVGKTSLAIEYVHRFRDLYAGVWWCPAETRASLLTSLSALSVRIGAATEADIEKAAKAALRWISERRANWLLIYDNVPSPELIADLLPTATAHVLITSRFSDWAGWAEEVVLDVLPLRDATSFLQYRAGSEDDLGARGLAQALGRLPLALEHSAATCRRTQMRFSDYAQRLATLIESAPRGTGYPRSVGATFDLAISEAAARSPAAEVLMAFLALCAPERIPMAMIEETIECEAERLHVIATLAELSLVKHDPFADGTRAVTIHRLVQAVARARSKANGTQQDAINRMMVMLLMRYPDDGFRNPNSWPLCNQLTPHLLAIMDFAREGDSILRSELLLRAGEYFLGRAFYAQAHPLLRESLTIRERERGTEHPETQRSLTSLAMLLQAEGDLASARPLFERALSIAESAFGPLHPATAFALNNLAQLSQFQYDFARAIPLFERALSIIENELGQEHTDAALILNNLAYMARDQGDLKRARPLFERALTILVKAYGVEDLRTAATFGNLATVLLGQGDIAGAGPLYERALKIHEKELGPDHPDTAMSIGDLACLREAESNIPEAKLLHERALRIYDRTLGADHPMANLERSRLAAILLAIGEHTEALALSEIALAAHEKILGQDHPWTRDSAFLTHVVLETLGRQHEAAALWTRYDLARIGHGMFRL